MSSSSQSPCALNFPALSTKEWVKRASDNRPPNYDRFAVWLAQILSNNGPPKDDDIARKMAQILSNTRMSKDDGLANIRCKIILKTSREKYYDVSKELVLLFSKTAVQTDDSLLRLTVASIESVAGSDSLQAKKAKADALATDQAKRTAYLHSVLDQQEALDKKVAENGVAIPERNFIERVGELYENAMTSSIGQAIEKVWSVVFWPLSCLRFLYSKC